MKSLIPRQGYLERVIPFINKNLIKVLMGQRRVGKSYLLFQLIQHVQSMDSNANIIYINKEDLTFDHIKNSQDALAYISEHTSVDSTNYLFVDEVQEIDSFEKVLRHYALKDDFDVYCTGSNANLLSGELATFLSGRYIEFKVYGLSFKEFLQFHQLGPSMDSLDKYLKWGGLPFLKNLNTSDVVISEYLENIYSSIIYKDVVSRFQIRNTFFLENLVKFLASNIGSLISAKKISDYLKSQRVDISPQVALNYLDNLQQACLVFKAMRKEIVGKKVFEVNTKIYFEDWGISNAIIGFQQMDVSKVIENVIYIHLKIQGYEVFVGKLGTREIDFIAERDGSKIYIQACYLISDDKVKEREFGNLLKIKDNYPKYVVSLDQYAPMSVEGVEHLHLLEFLTEVE